MNLGDIEKIYECDPEPEPFAEPIEIEQDEEAPAVPSK